jgi:hypothetical protein
MMLRFVALLLCLGMAVTSASARDLSAAAATREAQRDISAGRMKIYLAGTETPLESGVEPRDRTLVAQLPRDRSLPMGCTEPRAGAAIDYATVYNRCIIRHLRSKKSE